MQTSILLECIQASSYGQKGTVRGELSIQGLDSLDIENKHTLVIDDIYDSGHTMQAIVKALQSKKPASLKSLVLLHKQTGHSHSYMPDYILFPIEDEFVIGWGLDYKEHYRQLMSICAFQKGQ